MTDPAALIGTVVAGHYRVASLLGEGGMGVVYRAVHEELEREVALKLLHPGLGRNDALKERFLIEARAAGRLNHPGAVTVYDFGEWNEQLYLAMEFLKGRALHQVMRDEFPFAGEVIADIVGQACEVLHVAHQAGIMHRDIKPENLMLLDAPGARRQLKVVDFGLAFMLERADDRVTLEGTTLGTPAYMSPEQGMAKTVDARADIYSLGVVLYEMLCGRVPFEGHATEIVVKHLYDEPLRPEQMAPDLSVHRGLADVAMQCLMKAPGDRPGSALEMRDLLHAAVSKIGMSSMPPKKKPPKVASRAERAQAEGLVLPTPKLVDLPADEAAEATLLVVERTARFAESITAALRAKGFGVERVPDLDTLPAQLEALSPDAVIIDLVGDPDNRLNQIAAFFETGVLSTSTVILVGPVDSFGPMSRALELGVADYVPISAITTKLPRTLRRVLKRGGSG